MPTGFSIEPQVKLLAGEQNATESGWFISRSQGLIHPGFELGQVLALEESQDPTRSSKEAVARLAPLTAGVQKLAHERNLVDTETKRRRECQHEPVGCWKNRAPSHDLEDWGGGEDGFINLRLRSRGVNVFQGKIPGVTSEE